MPGLLPAVKRCGAGVATSRSRARGPLVPTAGKLRPVGALVPAGTESARVARNEAETARNEADAL